MSGKQLARSPASVEPSQREDAQNSLLDRALELGAMSPATQKLLDLTRRDDAEIGPVVDALAINPNLTAAVLRVANSAAYGQARSVADLRRAVQVIGMQEVHDLVAGTAMMSAFSRPHPLSERLQSTAVLSGAIAQKLAQRLRVSSASTAYLSGLMCELGALACVALDPEFPEVHLASEGDAGRRFEEEEIRYGNNTPMIGARILSMSQLPTIVSQAVSTTGFEHDASQSPLGRVVAFARLGARILVRAQEHGDPELLKEELTAAAALVGLEKPSPDSLVRICLAAATSAELTLRGEVGLLQTSPENDVDPITTSQAALKKSTRIRDAYLVAGALVLGAALATVAWLIFR